MAIEFGSPEAAKIVEEMNTKPVTFSLTYDQISDMMNKIDITIANYYGFKSQRDHESGVWTVDDGGLKDFFEEEMIDLMDIIDHLPELLSRQPIPRKDRLNRPLESDPPY